jgi:cell division protein FtsW
MSRLKTSLASNFLLALLILSAVGLFFVFEASTAESFAIYGNQHYFIVRQLIWFVVGMAGFLLAYLMPLKVWQKIAPGIYIVFLILLALTLVPSIGVEVNAAKRWIDIGFTSIQPVEFFKLALVIFFASWMSKHQRILPFVFLISLPAFILLLQPDVGSMLVLLMIAGGIYFTSGGDVKKFLPIAGVGILFLVIAIIASPYRLRRVKTFFDPQSDPLGASFQIRQITLALGSGGWFGRGLGNSQQKHAFIPEVSSDSIFSIVAEEVGFVGSMAIIALYSFVFFLIYKISLEQKSHSFEQLLAIGVLTWIAGQTILNLGSIVALVPLTGLPLPLFSYGGSSLVTVLFGAGLVYKMGKLKVKI